MSKYASLLFGPERYEEIGPFRFPIWKELVPGEVKGLERISKKQSTATFKSIKLAQKIGAERGISTQEAIDLLSQISQENNQDLVYQYAEELDEIQTGNMTEQEIKLEQVTLFIKFRGEAKLPGYDSFSPLKDWTTEDTENMPSAILDSIYTLLTKERNGWTEEGKGKESKVKEAEARP